MNDLEDLEKIKASGQQPPAQFLTLQKAIELGEYQPEFLSQYPEFQKLSKHAQFQLIRQAIDNRERQLITHWAEINNVLNFSEKPELKPALKKLEIERKKLITKKAELYLEYAESESSGIKQS